MSELLSAADEWTWCARQALGALSLSADVHVVVPDGAGPLVTADGALTVHHLPGRLRDRAEARRDLIASALDGHRGVDPALGSVLDEDLLEPWDGASAVVDELAPDRVVILGRRSVGAHRVWQALGRAVPYTLLGLENRPAPLRLDHFAPLVTDADSVVVMTERERRAVLHAGANPERVHRAGPPVAGMAVAAGGVTGRAASGEPDPWLGPGGVVLLADVPLATLDTVDVPLTPPTARRALAERRLAESARLLRSATATRPVAVVATDGMVTWRAGRETRAPAPVRPADLRRLTAGAHVVVDLTPGPVIARRSLVALGQGTPVLVPAGSAAEEHAAAGGGLWFSSEAELVQLLGALAERPEVAARLGAQGRAYAADHYGSPEAFAEALGQAVLPVPEPVAAARPRVARSRMAATVTRPL